MVARLYLKHQAISQRKTWSSSRGSVVDTITGFPLPGAHIIRLDSEPLQAATTDLNELFLLENVPLGRQSIQVSYVGYNSDFLTGAFPAEFGNATAGVFDLNLRSGNTNKSEFLGQIGFNGFELGAEGPAFALKNGQKASYLANFRYSTLEVMVNLGFDVGTGTAVPEYKDFTFLADLPGTKQGRFKVFGLWGTSMIRLGRDLADTTANQYNLRGTATDFGSDLAVVGTSHTYFSDPNTRIKSTLSWQQFNSNTVFDSLRNDAFIPVYRGDHTD